MQFDLSLFPFFTTLTWQASSTSVCFVQNEGMTILSIYIYITIYFEFYS